MEPPRARRLRSPLLLALAVLLAVEAMGGLVILFGRVAFGATPGLVLHVVAGLALTLGTMLVLTFAAAHLAAVLQRDRSASRSRDFAA